ncbi:MAG TPA: rod shape-determining protein RodA [Chloroflexota bacterium]|nr:rod shape-determining protein RodA [Chloroflexota bacterium]
MKQWRNFDLQLVGIPVALIAFSVFVLYSIAHWPTSGVTVGVPMHQALYAMLGLFLLFALTNFDYRLLRSLAVPLYLFGIALLGILFVLGHAAYGAQRWISLGILPLQPSEPAKLFLVIALARFWSSREGQVDQFSTTLQSLALMVIPAALVLMQPDLGTSSVFAAIWLGMALMAGVPGRHLIGIGAVSALLLPVAWRVMGTVKHFAYAQNRLMIFLNPQKDPLGAGYNVIHALITVGSGGVSGHWFRPETQSELGLLRVEDKDFIFSVIAEQIGFLGIIVLLAVFVFLLMRIARVSFMAGDSFGRLLAAGILSMLMFQIFVNVGMNIGLMPVTGIPLPLVSYGGSSLITTLAAFGILQSILLRHQKLVFGT